MTNANRPLPYADDVETIPVDEAEDTPARTAGRNDQPPRKQRQEPYISHAVLPRVAE